MKTRDCTVCILGDSYSTFEGYIPSHQKFYYPNPEKVPELKFVQETWWHQLTTRRNMRILINDSYSGSTVCNHTRDGQPPESAFIVRMKETLSARGIGGAHPDVIFIFGCTNDFWLARRVGQMQVTDWTKEDLNAALPAYGYLLDYVTAQNPQALVVCIVNDELSEEFRSGMRATAAHYGALCVELEGVDKAFGHPNCLGMTQIADQVDRALDRAEE